MHTRAIRGYEPALADLPTVLIGVITLAILMFTKKIPEPLVIVAAGVVGCSYTEQRNDSMFAPRDQVNPVFQNPGMNE
jgi:chromate transport protein ChrA